MPLALANGKVQVLLCLGQLWVTLQGQGVRQGPSLRAEQSLKSRGTQQLQDQDSSEKC